MNKNRLLIIAILLINTMIAGAQTGVRFSIFANPLINWFDSDTKSVKSGDAMFGFDAGLTVDNYFADNYAFTTGISIGTLGGNLEYEDSVNLETKANKENLLAPNTKVKFNLQYLTIPLGLKFKTKEIGYITYFAHLGLTTQLNIKARASSNDREATLDNDNIGPEIRFFNMGYHIGGGIQYSLGGNTSFIAGLTFTNGFTDITRSDNDNINTASLALRLGIMF